MYWSRALPEPFNLANGKRLATLQDAADLILRLPKARQGDVGWVTTTEALMRAAEFGSPRLVEKANLTLWRALRAEGLLTVDGKRARA